MLIIGCVNVTNLVLVRSTARMRELATRHALGASMSRLARQSFTESMLVAVTGGAAGLGLGWWALASAPLLGSTSCRRAAPSVSTPASSASRWSSSAVVGAVMAVLPVVALRGTNIAQMVREEGRSGTPAVVRRLARRALVTSQVAFALMLLIGAGAMVASLQRVLAVDPGFRGDHVLTGLICRQLALRRRRRAAERDRPAARTGSGDSRRRGRRAVDHHPVLRQQQRQRDPCRGLPDGPGESVISPSQVSVSDGYFEAMGARLVAGRLFNAGDTEGRQRVIVIDERLAQKFWPKGDALGKRMFQPESTDDAAQAATRGSDAARGRHHRRDASAGDG